MSPTEDDEFRASVAAAEGRPIRAWWRLNGAPRVRGLERLVWTVAFAEVVDVALHLVEVLRGCP